MQHKFLFRSFVIREISVGQQAAHQFRSIPSFLILTFLFVCIYSQYDKLLVQSNSSKGASLQSPYRFPHMSLHQSQLWSRSPLRHPGSYSDVGHRPVKGEHLVIVRYEFFIGRKAKAKLSQPRCNLVMKSFKSSTAAVTSYGGVSLATSCRLVTVTSNHSL